VDVLLLLNEVYLLFEASRRNLLWPYYDKLTAISKHEMNYIRETAGELKR
jgi:hypothetical protein